MGTTNLTVTIDGGKFSHGGASLLQGSQKFSELIGFGDSTIDTGYFFSHPISNNPTVQQKYQQAVAAGGGLPTDPNHPMNTTLLANAYGLTAFAHDQPNGTNYAASGATITGNAVNPLAPSVVRQIISYLAEHQNQADPNGLYYISAGGNSVKVAQSNYAALSDQQAYMVSEAHALSAAIASLYAAGARNFVLSDLVGTNSLSTSFCATLWADLEAAHIPFLVADHALAAATVLANPSSFGLTNVERPLLPGAGGSTISTVNSLSWALFATQEVSPTSADTYLWADGEHLSAAGQRLHASYTVNVIENAHPLISQVLTATPRDFGQGTVSNSSFQWQREADGTNVWSDIQGATSATYTVSASDVGSHLRVIVLVERTEGGSASAISPSTQTVLAQDAPSNHLTFYDTYESSNFTGGNGLDSAVFFNQHTAFSITHNSDSSILVSSNGTGVDNLTSVERLQFSDAIIALDVQGNAGDAYRLYQAAFARTPDKAGVSYWTHALDSGQNIVSVVAQSFVNSAEFKSVYGSNPTHVQIVDAFYHNVLGRPGEVEGFNYWVGQLDAGMSIATLLQSFAASPENHGHVDPVLAQGILLDQQAFLV